MSFKAGDKVKCIDNAFARDYFVLGESYLIDSVPSTDHVGFDHSGRIAWCADRFELIEKEDTVQTPKQFNPQSGHNVVASLQPGDKIICNNGFEFTCCSKETLLAKNPTAALNREKTILSYRELNGEYFSWQSWYENGQAGVRVDYSSDDYDIREVIPQEQGQSTPEEVQVEQLTYTPEDIRKAVIDDLGWQDLSLDLITKSLKKVTSKEYNEYLRLKAVFESDEE